MNNEPIEVLDLGNEIQNEEIDIELMITKRS